MSPNCVAKKYTVWKGGAFANGVSGIADGFADGDGVTFIVNESGTYNFEASLPEHL